MADTPPPKPNPTPKKPRSMLAGLTGLLFEAGKAVASSGRKPAPPKKLLGEPAKVSTVSTESPEKSVAEARLASLNGAERMRLFDFMRALPFDPNKSQTLDKAELNLELPWMEVAIRTRIGGHPRNKDNVYVNPLTGVHAVADGMMKQGALASATALGKLKELFDVNQLHSLRNALVGVGKKPEWPDRLKLLAGMMHDAVIEKVKPSGDEISATTLSGSVIDDEKLFVFWKGDSITLVVREGKVFYCSRPTSRLQTAVERLHLPHDQAQKEFEIWVDETEPDKIKAVFPEWEFTDKAQFKKNVNLGPGPLIGWPGDEDQPLKTYALGLEPRDTIISLTAGAVKALGLRAVPTSDWGDKAGPRFNLQQYKGSGNEREFPNPWKAIGRLATGSADDIAEKIDQLVKAYQLRTPGSDNATMVVTRYEPRKYVPSPEAFEEEDDEPTVEVEMPRLSVGAHEQTEHLDDLLASEPAPEEAGPEPRREPEAERTARDILLLKDNLKVLAEEHDVVRRSGDEVKADALLFQIWTVQEMLVGLGGITPAEKLAHAPEETQRVRGNYFRESIRGQEQDEAYFDGRYHSFVGEKKWLWAYRALQDKHSAQMNIRWFSTMLAWQEDRFSDLTDQLVELETNGQRAVYKVLRVTPPDDPTAPNMMVVEVRGNAGQSTETRDLLGKVVVPVRQLALRTEEWMNKVSEGAKIEVTEEVWPLDAGDLTVQATISVGEIRGLFRAHLISQKLDKGDLNGRPSAKAQYVKLRELLGRAVPTVPAQEYVTWANDVELVHAEAERLMKGT